MASGMGVRGTVSRCYGFFADFKQCIHERPTSKPSKFNKEDVVKKVEELKKSGETKVFAVSPVDKCGEFREDYFECLHGRKESARIRRVLEEQKKSSS